MKANLHPNYQEMAVDCACGNKFTVGGTTKSLHVDVCNQCHPFFTGTQKFLDTMGRVDKFIAKRQAAAGYVKKSKNQADSDNSPKTLKEMLEIKKAAKKATKKVAKKEVEASTKE